MSAADLRGAEVGFLRLLRAKRFRARFIEEHAEDLLAQARKEYADWLAAGRTAYNPPGWLINTAWRRTQELLDYQSRRPQSVSIEAVAELPNDSDPTPEQVAIRHEQGEWLRWAMGYLPPKERKVMQMVYFEGLTMAEAGRSVGWSAPNTTRHHRAALARLRSMLDGKLEMPMVEVGLAAWIVTNVRQDWSLRIALEPIRELTQASVDRIADLWRRIAPATDPANASLLSGSGRAAGVCSAAVLACVAGGVIGPGVGAVGVSKHEPPTTEVEFGQPQRDAVKPAPNPVSPPTPAPGPTPTKPSSGPALLKARTSPESLSERPKATNPRPKAASAEQVASEFGIEGRSAPAPRPSPAPSGTPDSAPSGAAPRPATPSDSSGGSASSGTEFGL